MLPYNISQPYGEGITSRAEKVVWFSFKSDTKIISLFVGITIENSDVGHLGLQLQSHEILNSYYCLT